MKTGKAILGGIGYRLDLHEGIATFVERDRMICTRITVRKCSPTGLLYVEATSATGEVAYAHIKKAVEIAEHFLGPNHYVTLRDKYRSERNIAAGHIVNRFLLRPWQRLFWTHELPFKIISVVRALRYCVLTVKPIRQPRVTWCNHTA